MNILFTDDEIYRNKDLVEYLELIEEHTVFWARTPKEAFDLFSKHVHTLNLVLLDIMLVTDDEIRNRGFKDDSGLKTGVFIFDEFERIAKENGVEMVDTIVVSARGDVEELFDGKSIHNNIRKPFLIEELLELFP